MLVCRVHFPYIVGFILIFINVVIIINFQIQPSVSLTKLPLRGIYLPCIVLTNLLTKILSTYRYLPVYLPLLTDMFTTTYRHIYRYLPAVSNLVSDTLGWYTEDWYTLSSVWYTVYLIHSGGGVYQCIRNLPTRSTSWWIRIFGTVVLKMERVWEPHENGLFSMLTCLDVPKFGPGPWH